MSLDDFLDSNYSSSMRLVSRGLEQSSDLSNLLHKDEQFQGVVASFFGKAPRNLPSTDAGISHFNLGKYCIAANQTAIYSASNLTGGNTESYLVPEGISVVSENPQLHRTSITNIDSHVDFFKLPVLSSHDLNRSQTSVKDASLTAEDIYNINCSRVIKRKQQPGSLTPTSYHASRKHEDSLHHDIKEEFYNSCLKKPRLDGNKDVIPQKYIIKQLLESQDSVQLQGEMALLKALLKQNKLQNGHKELILQLLPQFRGVEVKKHAHKQVRHHLRQPDICRAPAVHPFDGVCSRRLMQYVYHLRHRPPENGIAYWRKFLEEYYAPHAKKRWCLSLYDNVGHPSSGVFPQAAVSQWCFFPRRHYDLCGSKSGRGFEVTSEILPRLKKVSFESGVIDEILFLDMPCERRFASGLMILEYEKVVQESVYEQLRVVREGKLRIIFAYDLKILSWEFCARHHEELLQRSFIVPQIAGVVESMKDLMTFSRDIKIGPVGGLKKYPRQTTSIKPLMRGEGKEKLPLESVQSIPTDSNKLMALSPDFNRKSNGSLNTTYNPQLAGSDKEIASKLSKQTPTANASKWKEVPSHKYNSSKDATSTKPSRGPKTSSLGLSQDLLFSDSSSYNFSESSKNIQDYMIQKWLQEMINNSRVENNGDNEKLNQGIGFSTPTGGLQTKEKGTEAHE